MTDTQQGILALLKSAVTGEKITLPESFSWEEAAPVVQKQTILPLVFQGILNSGLPIDSPRMQRWRLAYCRNVITSQNQMRALEAVFDGFEKNGIAYLPVKGCNLKKLYPQPDLRQMGDGDILIRPEQHDAVCKVLQPLGFAFLGENEHVFEWRSDVLFLELHKSLVPPADEEFFAYYQDIWSRARKGEGHRYDLTVEDTFVFLLVHFARHYRSSGIGCQHVLDLYVFRRENPQWDQAYLKRELKKLHLLEFYENTMHLLDVWFAGKKGDEISELMTAFIFSGGRWGTVEAELLLKQVRKAEETGTIRSSGVRAFFSALFPSRKDLTYRYPILLHHPWLLPILWVVRWFQIGLTEPGRILRKLEAVRSVSDSQVLDHRKALQTVGLSFYSSEDTEEIKISRLS